MPTFSFSRALIGVAVIVALAASNSLAQITVKQDGTGDFTSIQSAVDNAPNGSLIVVHPGLYLENLLISGSADLTIESTDPTDPAVVGSTVVAPAVGPGSALSQINSSGSILISGLTFDKLPVSLGGTGDVTLNRCVFLPIDAIFAGTNAAVLASSSGNVLIISCTFGQRVTLGEVAIGYLAESRIQIVNSVIYNFFVGLSFVPPSGQGFAEAEITNTTFANNFTDISDQSGATVADLSIRNSIFSIASNNTFSQNASVSHSLLPSPPPMFFANDGGGNRFGVPVFVDAANGDFRLVAGSPGIDAGRDRFLPTLSDLGIDPTSTQAITFDRDRNPRVATDTYNLEAPFTTGFSGASAAIPDAPSGQFLSATFPAGSTLQIDRLEVGLLIDHTFVNDLDIDLTSPDGTLVNIWNRACGNDQDINTTLGDGVGSFACSSPVGPVRASDGALGFFDGEGLDGTWTLDIRDLAAQDTGTLRALTLTLRQSKVDMGAYEFQHDGYQSVQSRRLDADTGDSSTVRFSAQFANSVAGVDASDIGIETTGDINDAQVVAVDPSAGLRIDAGAPPFVLTTLAGGAGSDTIIEFWTFLDAASPSMQALFETDSLFIGASAEGTLLVGNVAGPSQYGAARLRGRWTHVAVRVDEIAGGVSFVEVFVDGESVDAAIESVSVAGQLRVGGDPGSEWRGNIDAVRIWEDSGTSLSEILDNRFRRLSGREPGLIGYWRFDEILDLGAGDPGPNDTPNAVPGGQPADLAPAMARLSTSSGRPTSEFPAFVRDGGGDQIRIPFDPRYGPPSGFTIEAEVRAGDIASNEVARILSIDNSGGERGWGFGQFLSGQMVFTHFGVQDYVLNVQPFTPGEWVHVAVVFDNSFDANFYVDGNFVGKVNGNQPFGDWRDDLFIGRGVSFQRWDGNIRQVRIWDDIRTPLEIVGSAGIALTTSQINDPNLVGYWPLDSFDDLGVGAPGHNDVRDISTLANNADASTLDQGFRDRYFITVEAPSALDEDGTIGLDFSGAPDGSIIGVLGVPATLTPELSAAYTFANGCPADLAPPNGSLDFFDVLEYFALFDAQDPAADLAAPFGGFDFFDVLEYLAQFDAGC